MWYNCQSLLAAVTGTAEFLLVNFPAPQQMFGGALGNLTCSVLIFASFSPKYAAKYKGFLSSAKNASRCSSDAR